MREALRFGHWFISFPEPDPCASWSLAFSDLDFQFLLAAEQQTNLGISQREEKKGELFGFLKRK